MVMPTNPSFLDSLPTYADALNRLLSLADFERTAGVAAPIPKTDLSRMRELVRLMAHPEGCAPVIHVAGTKGKGSVSAMVSSILTTAGLRVGLFTSPHLHTFRERIRIDGDPIDEERFACAVRSVWPHVEEMAATGPDQCPTTFEVLTAMAFSVFRAEAVDVQVIEVGLGGRLDSTNVVDSAVAVVTSLSLDHTAILGNTLAAVAAEKAGIVKGAAPVVLAPQSPEAKAVLEATAARVGASLIRVGTDVTYEASGGDLLGQNLRVATAARVYDVRLPLLGAHQRENAAAAIAAVEAAGFDLPAGSVERGLGSVRWDGRFQVLTPGSRGDGGDGPTVVVDGAHNPYSAACLAGTVRECIVPTDTILVFGCSGDKELDGMVSELAPLASLAIVCTSRHPRALPPSRVAAAFEAAGVNAIVAPSVASALEQARREASPTGLVLATGSLFVAAEALQAWYGIQGEEYPEFTPYQTAAGEGRP